MWRRAAAGWPWLQFQALRWLQQHAPNVAKLKHQVEILVTPTQVTMQVVVAGLPESVVLHVVHLRARAGVRIDIVNCAITIGC